MTTINENGIISGLKVKRSWKTKVDKNDDNPASVNMVIDFEGINVKDLAEFAVQQLVIRRQAVERKLSKGEIESFSGVTIHYSQMGIKVKSREERIQGAMALGISRIAAELMLDNPEKAEEAAKEVRKSMGESGE